MSFDLVVVETHLPEMFRALWMTVQLSLLTTLLCTPLAFGLALARERGGRRLASLAALYVVLFRAVPALLVLYFAFYGLPGLGVSLRPFTAALLGLTVASAAYMAEDLRGPLRAVDDGQWQAAHALGLGYGRILWRIVLPQAIPRMLPPYMSRLTVIVKSTALASIVSVNELTGETYALLAATYHATEFLTVSALFYLVVNAAIAIVQRAVERRFELRIRRRPSRTVTT